jgi:UrcA family protein
MKTSRVARVVLALCIIPGLAAAAGHGGSLRTVGAAGADTRQVAVAYGDLDLTREEGLAVLYGRLRTAAREVCAPLEATDMERRALHARCVQQALDRAIAGAGNPQLVALHALRTEKVAPPTLRLAEGRAP